MNSAGDKTEKVREVLDTAKQTAEIGSVIAPGKVGRGLGTGVEIIEAAQAGLTVWDRINSLFKKKKKK
jgi:hypothetical protein